MVSEIHLDRRFRLHRLHGREPATLRGSLRSLSWPWTAHERASLLGQDRRHRRRHRRLLHRLPSRQDGAHRRAAARARQAHLRLDLACRRPGRATPHQRQYHPAARLFRRSLRPAGKGDRARHRLEAERRLAACLQRGALDRGEAAGDHRHLLRPRNASADAEGGARAVAADAGRATWWAPRSCRPTDRRRRRISPCRWPRARAYAGVTITEGVSVTGIETEGGRVRAVVTDKGRIACDKLVDLRRPMVARARPHGRRQCSARLGAAPISDHRAD